MGSGYQWHIPQGSVLGPLLFLIYVGDLPDWIKNDMRMFADDTIRYVAELANKLTVFDFRRT